MVDLPDDDRALEELLRNRRFGPPDAHAVTPWDFVLRWPEVDLRARVWPIVSRMLVDADELVRARAVELARGWSAGEELVVPRLLEVAETHASLYGDQTPERETLRSALGNALSAYAGPKNGPRIAALLRPMVAHEPMGTSVAGALGHHDPMFVAAQARRWGDERVGWFAAAANAMALVHRDAVIPFLQAFRDLSRESRERILAEVEEYISRDDATAAARARSWGKPPPTRPAPALEECRRAIRLSE